MHRFDAGSGGGYEMSLFYPSTELAHRGKTAEREDRVSVRFVELTPPAKIIEAVTFHSPNPAFSGEMTLEARFEQAEGGTDVTILCTNIPPGIRPEDNEAGSRSSLDNLARYVE